MAATRTIVGREAELERLRQLVQGDEAPFVAFVVGEAGIGKTALLDTLVAEAVAAGTLVLQARPTAAEAASSYSALDDLLRPAIGGLAQLPDPQRRAVAAALLLEDAAGPVDPRVVGLGCLSLLDGLPGDVLLAVDDWQWLDAATAAVLGFVLRRLAPGRARALATVRSGEADEALATLLRGLPALELAVAPLGAAELGRVIHARTGERLAPPALARLHASCRGNPLMALELIRAPEAARATDVRRLLARRLAALPPDTRALLRVVAALADADARRGGGRSPGGPRGGARRRRPRPRRRPAALHPPADRRGGGGAHPARGVAGVARPVGPVGGGPRAARAPPRRRRGGPGRGGRRGARGGRRPGHGPRRDDGRGGAG